MGEGFLLQRCPTALGHYATHGTINSTPTVGPEILPLLCKQPAANTQIRQRQIRKTGGEANTKNGSGKYQSKQSGRGVRLLENVFRDRVGNDLRHGGISRSLCRGWQGMILSAAVSPARCEKEYSGEDCYVLPSPPSAKPIKRGATIACSGLWLKPPVTCNKV